MIDVEQIIYDFMHVAKLAGIDVKGDDIQIEKISAPHTPPSTLPKGKMAVYVFHWCNQCLKVGKVGPKSQARYTSQHYSPKSSNSNLAKSILKDVSTLGIGGITEQNVGNWIKHNTDRINFIIPMRLGAPLLSLLESFLQCRLKPRFEGFDTQK
ncbi:MAG: hypothetical protein RBT20_07110 [Syntrophales bacterium]|jgi:hypothetical protein|nr:hypothetical protein [Syntrophales bacterium]